ncbi:hypothetical protein [Mucilaginibacter sp.]|uniref:hypothetical protein n=1 Tax=Mucilaginibacter sp. TaxID=1882438 RepID=UPI0025EAA508|nr:hypothetical protein [Mucilaginibacter sp.]
MKSKIFNPFLFALMILLALGTGSFAQQKKPAKPARPAKPAAAPKVAQTDDDEDDSDDADMDSKDYQLKMKDLQIKMKDLQIKMSALNKQKFNKTMKLNMKKFNKSFKGLDKNFKLDTLKGFAFKLNDSMLNFAYKFDTNIAPMIAYGFKDFDKSFNFSYDSSDDDNDKQQQSAEEVVKTKSYSKSYNVDANDVINIDNKFGKVIVNTWNKNEVKVDVQIKVTTNNDDKAQKLLDDVNIKDGKDGNGVYFKTTISSDEDSNGSWGSFFKGSRNSVRSIEVNYTVYMPAKSPLTISNKYGSTDLPDLSGKLIINNSFGSLVAKTLSNPGNQIKVKYGNATIGNLNGSDLDVAYGSLSLGDCDRLNANLSYSSAKIGRIKTSGNINVKFGGGISIEGVDKNLKDLSVKSSYSSIKLGLGDDQTADFDVTVRYGSFNYGNRDVSLTSKTPADGERGFNPTKNYKGHFGKGGTDKTITINSTFGSVNFD